MARAKLTKSKIKNILKLADEHWKNSAIARKYHIDHSTVFYHIDKARRAIVSVKIDPPADQCEHYIAGLSNVSSFNDDVIIPINSKVPQKNYSDFVNQSEIRRIKKQETCKHQTFQVTVACKCCGVVVIDTLRP